MYFSICLPHLFGYTLLEFSTSKCSVGRQIIYVISDAEINGDVEVGELRTEIAQELRCYILIQGLHYRKNIDRFNINESLVPYTLNTILRAAVF